MSNVVPKKVATKKVATTSSSKLKLSFHLKYKTHFGQVIYLYGNHPQLGNHQIDQAIPMVYLLILLVPTPIIPLNPPVPNSKFL